MQNDLDVNPAFKTWKLSTGREKEFALGILIRLMERFATAVCLKRIPDHRDELAALVNGIVWRAIKRMERFRGGSQFSTWFYRIIVNECNRFLRNHIKRLEVSIEEETPAQPQAFECRLDLIAMLDALEGPEHTLLRLVIEGQDFRTIAKELKITRNAAIVRWSRLKARLRDAI